MGIVFAEVREPIGCGDTRQESPAGRTSPRSLHSATGQTQRTPRSSSAAFALDGISSGGWADDAKKCVGEEAAARVDNECAEAKRGLSDRHGIGIGDCARDRATNHAIRRSRHVCS